MMGIKQHRTAAATTAKGGGDGNTIWKWIAFYLFLLGFVFGHRFHLIQSGLILADTTSNVNSNGNYDDTIHSAAQIRSQYTLGGGRSRLPDGIINQQQPAKSGVVTKNNDNNNEKKQAVIVTKIHGPEHYSWNQLKQSLCLLTAAYNGKAQHDIIIFTSLPVPQTEIREMELLVAPAKVEVVVDQMTFQDQMDALTPSQQELLLQRCSVTSLSELHWKSKCEEDNSHTVVLSYAWQAEFRSKHLWKEPRLQNYRYMMWYDSDAMATQVFPKDPIQIMEDRNLALLFSRFPYGITAGNDIRERIQNGFDGQSLCKLKLTEGKQGHMVPMKTDCGDKTSIKQIHGFFHISEIALYTSEAAQKWNNALIGDLKFSRRFDDQLQITVVAAMLAPERAWEMHSLGIVLNVLHNGLLDGKEPILKLKGGYLGFMKEKATEEWKELVNHCPITNAG